MRFSTKHGFNEFREGRAFALGDRTVASLAHVHIAISRGLARYLAQTEGFREESFEIVHYGIAPNGEPEPYAGDAPRLLCVGRLIPIKGHIVLLRAFAAAKKEIPGLELDIAGRGPLEPALRALARELGVADAVRFLGYVAPIQGAIERSAIVVVPVDGRGLRDGRARGDGARAAGDRRRDRRSRRARPRRRDGPARRAGRGRAAARGDRRARREPRAGRGDGPRRAGSRALLEFLEDRCVDRTEILYRSALARARRPPAVRSAIFATENSLCARARPAAPIAAARAGSRAGRAPPSASAAGSSGGTSTPVSPSTTISGAALTRVATTGLPRQHRLEQREPEALPARRDGRAARRAGTRPRRRRPGPAGRRPRRRDAPAGPAPGPSPSTTSTASGCCSRIARSARTATSTPFCSREPRDAEQDARAVRQRAPPGSSPHGSGSASSP